MFHNKHEFTYRLTDFKGNVIYCDEFDMIDSSAIIVLSSGDTLQMDSIVDISPNI